MRSLRALRAVLRAATRQTGIGVVFLAAAVTACSDDTIAGGSPSAHVRVVNSLFQGADVASATPQAIDYMIDSSLSSPGLANLAGNAVSSGDDGSGFRALSGDVHSFAARLAGNTTTAGALYTTTGNLPYLVRQYIRSGAYATIIVGGIIPATGPVPANTIPFTILADDPFPPPKFNGTYQARFKFVNAAPYASASGTGSTVLMWVSPGDTVPSPGFIGIYNNFGQASFRGQTGYANVDAGTYMVTFTVGTGATATILAQQAVTFAPGDVKTLVLQSTGYAATPGPANHKVTALLDAHYNP